MTAGTIAPYRSQAPAGHDGFAQLLHAEWTKFRTVRGWLIGLLVAPLLTVLLGALTASGNQCGSMGPGPGGQLVPVPCSAPFGPGGQAVTDQFYFVHQPLAANGAITVRMTSLTSTRLQPWAKAGIIIKANTTPGSAYAAMMATGSHGVRMQYDFTQDTAGLPGTVSAASPRWLRLTRAGDTITGYDSADGTRWTEVGRATLPGLPPTVQIGLFATSPAAPTQASHVQAGSDATTAADAVDHVSLQGTVPGATWTGTAIGGSPFPAGGVAPTAPLPGFHQAGDTYTVTGGGDIAPAVPPGNAGTPISQTLDGAFAGLIVVAVIGAMFITAEYRRGLIHTTLAATPGRGRVLAAKAVIIGAVTFVAGFAGAAIAIPVSEHLLRENGNFFAPVSAVTWLRVVGGTAGVFAATAVLALAVGAVLRRSAAAVTTVIVVAVLPYLLAVASPAVPDAAADWLLRLTPTAAFAIQQTIPQYSQVDGTYTPFNGFFPLAPWAGFAVLCGWTVVALGLAVYLLRRRDA